MSPRGPDWANAGARLCVALSLPVLASVLFKVLNGRPNTTGGVLVVLLWMLGLPLGAAWAREAWHARLARPTVRLTGAQVAGRTGWPLRRWRSVRLDRLARVRCTKSFEQGPMWGGESYLLLRDLDGGRVMVEIPSGAAWPEGLRRALLRAIDDSPSVRVGPVTRRRLAGHNPLWTVPLWFLRFVLAITVGIVVALLICVGLGALR
ncbi:MAG: hypothetical protein J2P15_05675 [Micromonosporaceae bacterium]|nr:hypothetical protein [Micromonosporaceae bacterium]